MILHASKRFSKTKWVQLNLLLLILRDILSYFTERFFGFFKCNIAINCNRQTRAPITIYRYAIAPPPSRFPFVPHIRYCARDQQSSDPERSILRLPQRETPTAVVCDAVTIEISWIRLLENREILNVPFLRAAHLELFFSQFKISVHSTVVKNNRVFFFTKKLCHVNYVNNFSFLTNNNHTHFSAFSWTLNGI